jgi:eukaryotic-like serine/threonine-protein kinase
LGRRIDLRGRSLSDSIPAASFPDDQPARSDEGLGSDADSGADRYVQERLLGEGAMGAVYLVRDRETGEQLALKKLYRMDGRSALRVKREFRSIADMSHPNLVKVYDLGRARDGWFLTMEYLEGEELSAYLACDEDKASSCIDSALSDALRQRSYLQERVVPAFYQLASGVQALHRAAMLHRDLKPSNVLVSHGRVVVLDFGLLRELDPAAATLTEEGAIAGTPAYMAPEQALGKPLCEASDWYAFGAMLYEALTGELPIDGTLLEMLQRKLDSDPLPAVKLNPAVPAHLSQLCAALLSRDPSARPSGKQVLSALEPVSAGPVLTLGQLTGETSLVSEERERASARSFFGRQAEVEALRSALRDTESGRAVVAHVRGTSGAGKSVLVEQFLDQVGLYGSALRHADALVLRSRCYEREAMPFKALDGVIDALSRHLAHLDDVEVSHLLPTQIAALAQLFPVLERLRAVQHLLSARKLGSDDAVHNRQRAEAALRDLFARLTAQRPVVIWIDDLQWGDLDSARILNGWLRGAEDLPLLLVFSYRSDEIETSECLRFLLGASAQAGSAREHVISVTALAPENVHALCREQLGALALGRDALIERIVREAQGSPFLATQLAALAQAKLQRGDADLDTLTIADMVEQTAELLPREGRHLLSVLAVAGRPIQPKLALRAAGLRHGGRELLHALRRLQMVRTREVAGERLLEVYHDRVREAVQRTLQTNQLERIHESLLLALEYSGRADPDWLHALALGAGQRVAAYRYGLAAAERAKATLAFERAVELYTRCVALGEEHAEDRGALWQKLADALGWCGRGAMAADAYLEAANLSKDRRESLHLMRLATSHLLRSGRFEQGEAMLQRVLRAMDLSVPETRSGLVAAIAWERTRAAVRGGRYTERREEELPAALLARIDTYQAFREETLSIHPLRAALFGARQARWAFESGEPMRVLQALCGRCYLAATTGSARADELLVQVRALASQIGTPEARGAVCGMEAVACWMLGRPQAVLEPASEAEQIFRTLAQRSADANYYMRLNVAAVRIGALYELGDYRAFADELSRALREARATDNIAAQLAFALNETLLDELTDQTNGTLARLDRQRQQLPRGEFGVYHALHMVAVTFAACWHRELAWGMRYMEEDWPRYLGSSLRATAQIAALARWSRLRLLLDHHLANGAQTSYAAELQSGLGKLIKASNTSRSLSFAYSLRARLSFGNDDKQSAISLLRTFSELPAGRVSMAEADRNRYALGRMLGGDEGAQLVRDCERSLAARGVQNPGRYARGYFPELFDER